VLGVEQVIARHPGLADQPFQEVFPEAGRMIDGETHVLIKVKHLHARPVDAGRGGERVEKLELRCAGCGNDPSGSAISDRLAECAISMLRGSATHRGPIDVGVNSHVLSVLAAFYALQSGQMTRLPGER
jgi:hypothetical protein